MSTMALGVEDIDREALARSLSQAWKEKGASKVIKVECEDVVNPGENYCSDLVRTKAILELKDGTTIQASIIVKKRLTNLIGEAHNYIQNFFKTEEKMYTSILPELSKLIIEKELKFEVMWPVCYAASSDAILMEDLKESGYKLEKRWRGIDLDHATLIMTTLARLHCVSLIGRLEGRIDFNILGPCPFANPESQDLTFIINGIEAIATDIKNNWEPTWWSLSEKLFIASKNIARKIIELAACNSNSITVVSHGDCWINNIMFKYSDDNRPKSPKFIDFQSSHCNSYGWDLTMILFSSLLPDVRKEFYDSLLTRYCDEFRDCLEKAGWDINHGPTLDDVKAEIRRLHPLALACALSYLPLVLNTSSQQVPIDQLLSNSKNYRSFFSNNYFRSATKANIQYFIDNKLL